MLGGLKIVPFVQKFSTLRPANSLLRNSLPLALLLVLFHHPKPIECSRAYNMGGGLLVLSSAAIVWVKIELAYSMPKCTPASRQTYCNTSWACQGHPGWPSGMSRTAQNQLHHHASSPSEFGGLRWAEAISIASLPSQMRRTLEFYSSPCDGVSKQLEKIGQVQLTARISLVSETWPQSSADRENAVQGISFWTRPSCRIVVIGPNKWSVQLMNKVIACEIDLLRAYNRKKGQGLRSAGLKPCQAYKMPIPTGHCYGAGSWVPFVYQIESGAHWTLQCGCLMLESAIWFRSPVQISKNCYGTSLNRQCSNRRNYI